MHARTGRRGRTSVPSRWLSALIAATVLTLGIGTASAASLGLSKGEMEQFARQLGLTSQQRPKVTAITQTLVSTNAAIMKKYGVRAGSCTDLPLTRLSALNSEANTAFQRARSQLSQVLSANQLSQFSAIYQQKRRATQSTIVCRSAQASR